MQGARGAAEFDDDDAAVQCDAGGVTNRLKRILSAGLAVGGCRLYCCTRWIEDKKVVVITGSAEGIGPLEQVDGAVLGKYVVVLATEVMHDADFSNRRSGAVGREVAFPRAGSITVQIARVRG